ncbi:GNAT family N-acetyltransferase [Roseateles sp. BYS180W]|uniref:GNAT family N-acetyltransferase n=1 Tax=Roseateles rivi TaxID=3299028 RepID=A0ABW7FTX4_9BURK
MHTLPICHCSLERHGDAVLDIFNEAIAHTTALYEYQPRTPQRIAEWFETKARAGHPVLGLEDAQGQLLGFASWGPFRGFAAFKYTVEHSVYVHHQHRGRGLGPQLLQALIERAQAQGLHALVGAIDAANAGSIALHQRLGFVHVGTLPQVGFKFGRWLDLAFYQRLLDTPAHPVDG